MGNCIGVAFLLGFFYSPGKRNYRYFVTFLVLTVFNSVTTIVLCGTHLALLTINFMNASSFSSDTSSSFKNTSEESEDNGLKSLGDALKVAPDSLIIGTYAAIGVWSIVGLTFYHLGLIARGISTNEDIKRSFKAKINPYIPENAWCLGNLLRACCGPLKISYFAFQPKSAWTACPVVDLKTHIPETHSFTSSYTSAGSSVRAGSGSVVSLENGHHLFLQEVSGGDWMDLDFLGASKSSRQDTGTFSTSNSFGASVYPLSSSTSNS